MSRKAVIDSIEKNAAKLVGDNRRLRSEVERLTASREKLRDENARLASEMVALRRRLAVKDLAEGFGGGVSGSDNVKIARARVNRLMREVDKCIGLLNRTSQDASSPTEC
jgi:regulator of replication initiation timing